MTTSNNKVIVVLGMHRSGTSVVARSLQVMGVNLGDRLMPAIQGENDKGFWEDLDINSLNMEMLNTINSDWHFLAPIQMADVATLRSGGYHLDAVEMLRKKTSDFQNFGFKDPRVAKLLLFWKEVFAEKDLNVHYVLAIRNPLSVSTSLAKRNGFEPEKSYLLWLEHVLNSLNGTSGEKRVLVDYDHLMQSPDAELKRLAGALQFPINVSELEKFKSEFLDDKLRHTVYQINDLSLADVAHPLASEVYSELLNVLKDDQQLEGKDFKNKIKRWNIEFSRLKSALVLADKLTTKIKSISQVVAEKEQSLQAFVAQVTEKKQSVQALTAQVAEKEQSVQVLTAHVAEKEQELSGIYCSKAWRVAMLLRRVREWLVPHGIQGQIRLLNSVSKKVSIIIPNYNGQKFLGECLDSLHQIDFLHDQYEIIVVDNASSDNSRGFISSMYPDVILAQAERNLGFAGGCNLGIKNSRGEYIVLLNNDTVVDTNWLKELVAVADGDKDVAIVGSKLLYKHNPNEIQNAGSYLTSRGDGGDVGSHQPHEGQYDTTREVMAVCGASMLVRRTLIEEIGALDEDFVAYYEDTDLCYRTKLYGKKIVFASKSIVYHVHAATSGEWSPFFTFLVFRNKLLMHLKNSRLDYLLKVLFLYFSQVLYEGLVKSVNRKTHLRVLVSFVKKFPKFLIKRFYVRSIIKRESDGRVLLRLTKVKSRVNASSVKKVCIYNAYLPTMGGGENLTAHTIAYINSAFPSASVDILCHETDAFDKSRFAGKEFVRMLETEFDISLKNTAVRFVDFDFDQKSFIGRLRYIYKLSSVTREYDLFINNTYASLLPARAKVNIFYCMFPLKYEYCGNPLMGLFRRLLFNRFLMSYDMFLAISQYTQSWIDNYWKVNSYVLYPPVKIEKKSINQNKDNIIINVGRFFVSGHNKKQDVMVKTFIEMCDKGWAGDWKLVFVGRKHSDEASMRYVRSLEEAAKGYPIELRYDTNFDELQNLLNKAKIYWHATGYGDVSNVNPEKFEHFGLSTIEAAQFGAVPVVFNGGGQPEIVNHAQNGFLWNTTDELIAFTKLLIDNDSVWSDLSSMAINSTNIFGEKKQLQWFVLFLSSYFKFE